MMEERLAHVEGLVAGHAQLLGDLRAALTQLEVRMDRRFEQVDRRFEQVDRRFEQVDARLDAMTLRFDDKIDALRRESMNHFRWQMGTMVTLFAVVVGAILAR